jgi:hypothetical protein
MGQLATGTSCLALVCVISRSRVPVPPLRISAYNYCTAQIACGMSREGG